MLMAFFALVSTTIAPMDSAYSFASFSGTSLEKRPKPERNESSSATHGQPRKAKQHVHNQQLSFPRRLRTQPLGKHRKLKMGEPWDMDEHIPNNALVALVLLEDKNLGWQGQAWWAGQSQLGRDPWKRVQLSCHGDSSMRRRDLEEGMKPQDCSFISITSMIIVVMKGRAQVHFTSLHFYLPPWER